MKLVRFGCASAFLISCFFYFLTAIPPAYAITPLELQNAIQEKTKALQDLDVQIAATQQSLNDATEQGRTLKQELVRINYSLSQLNLSVRASETTIEKLGLEMTGLQSDITDAETQSDDKRLAIQDLLRALQQKDDESALINLIKNRSLADGLLEAETIRTLNSGLADDVNALEALQKDLSAKFAEQAEKKRLAESEQKNLLVRKALAEEQKNDRQALIAQTKNQESLYQKQIEDLKKQQNAVSDEIGKIEDRLRATFNASLLPTKRPGVFAWPVQMVGGGGAGRITQRYGERSALYRGKPHNGLDIGVPLGTPVYAADDGVVLKIDNNDQSRRYKYQYGKYVLIKHNNNLATIYGHLSRQVVATGDVVKRGDLIGYSGSTGYATGPHLHFGAYWVPSITLKSIPPAAGLVPVGVTINPEDYL